MTAKTRLQRFFDRLKGRSTEATTTIASTTTASSQLDCRNVVVLVTDYLEAQLSPEVQAAFEAHLAGCIGCTNYVEQMRKTIGMLRTLTQEPTFPETTDELRQLFRTWKQNDMPEQK